MSCCCPTHGFLITMCPAPPQMQKIEVGGCSSLDDQSVTPLSQIDAD